MRLVIGSAALAAGCGGDHATIQCSLRIEQAVGDHGADCSVTFNKAPRGELTNVRLELSGPTVEGGKVAYDWAELVKLDGHTTTAEAPPPLATPLRWRVALPLVRTLQPHVGDFIVHARLYWAGKERDMARLNTKAVYHAQ